MKAFCFFAAVALAASAEGTSLRATVVDYTIAERHLCLSEDRTCANAGYENGSYIAINSDGSPLMASKYFVCLNAEGRKQEHLMLCEHGMSVSGLVVRFGCNWWDGSSAYAYGIPVERLLLCDRENGREYIPSSGELKEWPEAEHQLVED